MNKSIYISSLKKSKSFIAIISSCVAITLISLVALFPSIVKDSSYSDLLETMPNGLLSAIGMNGDVTNFNDFLNMNFYNSIYLYILMAFIIVLSTKLISKPIDDTSLIYYLNSPVSRVKFLISQIVVFITGLVIVCLSSVLFTYIGKLIFANEYDFNTSNFIKDNILLGCLFLFLGSISILISSMAKSNSSAISYSSTIIVTEYFLDMIGKMGDNVIWMKNMTIFTFYNTDKIHDGTDFLLSRCSILIVASVALIVIAVKYFKRRDLYL